MMGLALVINGSDLIREISTLELEQQNENNVYLSFFRNCLTAAIIWKGDLYCFHLQWTLITGFQK